MRHTITVAEFRQRFGDVTANGNLFDMGGRRWKVVDTVHGNDGRDYVVLED